MKTYSYIFSFYFRKAFTIKGIMVTLIWINFMIFFWNIFLGAMDGFYLQLTVIMLATVTVVETYLYQKASNKVILKFQTINNNKKLKVSIYLFLITFLYAWVTLLLFFGFIWMYQYFNVLNINTISNNGDIYISFINNSSNWWIFLFYQFNLLILLVIIFVYFLNHFIKMSSFVYGVMMILAMFSLTSFLANPLILWMRQIDGTYVFVLSSKTPKIGRLLLSLIISPWMITQPFIMKIIMESNGIATFQNVNYFDYSNLGVYANLSWIPWFIMISLMLLAQFSDQIISLSRRLAKWN